jgi:DNA-binding transcriptional regulator of glucitol operon
VKPSVQASGEFLCSVVPGIIRGVRERWLSRRAVFLHLGFLLFVPFCSLATWWQITRAEDGNGLSYLYTVEWPVFAGLGVYFWWMFLHTDYNAVGLKGMRAQTVEAPSPQEDAPETTAPSLEQPIGVHLDEVDPELAAYNQRLAALSTSGGKTWRKPEAHVARRLQ